MNKIVARTILSLLPEDNKSAAQIAANDLAVAAAAICSKITNLQERSRSSDYGYGWTDKKV